MPLSGGRAASTEFAIMPFARSLGIDLPLWAQIYGRKGKVISDPWQRMVNIRELTESRAISGGSPVVTLK